LRTTFGPYEIDAADSADGPYQVFRARRRCSSGLERPCRLRILDLGSVSGSGARVRFLDEANLVVGLQHPGIVALQDYGVVGAELFLEEELFEGVSLRGLLTRHGRLEQGVALAVAVQLASILTHVHEACDAEGRPLRLVHRNLVPSYVNVTPHGEVKLSGFGLARFRGQLARTAFGHNRDHVGNVSPEEALGQITDHRSDLFGLGALLYEMVTGRPPFAGETLAATGELVGRGSYVPPGERAPQLHESVGGIIAALLQRDPADRPANAQVVWEELWRIGKQAGTAGDGDRLRELVAAASTDRCRA